MISKYSIPCQVFNLTQKQFGKISYRTIPNPVGPTRTGRGLEGAGVSVPRGGKLKETDFVFLPTFQCCDQQGASRSMFMYQ